LAPTSYHIFHYFAAQELEKFKFVLEYSLGEVRAQLEPKDAQLADMRGRVQVSLRLQGGCGGAARWRRCECWRNEGLAPPRAAAGPIHAADGKGGAQHPV
jgi:hypothetical protein